MFKKWLASLVALIIVVTIALPVQAASKDITLYFQEQEVQLSQPAYIENGTTYVPIRSFLETVDYKVSFDAASKQIHAYDGYDYIVIDINNKNATMNDEIVIQAIDLKFNNNTYFAPVRQLEPVTFTTTTWDPANQRVIIESLYQLSPSEGFLWKVSKGDNTVYLLGSIHIGIDMLYPLRDELYEAFYLSDVLSTEVDFEKELTEEEKKEIESLTYLPEGVTIKDKIDPRLYETLSSVLKMFIKDEEVIADINRMQLWQINLILNSLLTADEAEAGLGIESHFEQLAAEAGHEIDQVENLLIQYRMLAGFSEEHEQQALLSYLLNIQFKLEAMIKGEEIPQVLDDSFIIWRNGDLESLDYDANMLKQHSAEYYDAMLTVRNAGITDKIEQYLNNSEPKTYFVIVGAMHFAGEDSIQLMLEERGYEVERL